MDNFSPVSEQENASTQEKRSAPVSRVNKVLNAMAYPISAFIGGFYTHNHIRNASYDSLTKVGDKKGGAFHQEYQTRHDTAKRLLEQFEHNQISGHDFTQARHAADIAYSKATDNTLQKLGYTSMWKRFRHLDWDHKLQAVMTFATVTGIALGVTLTIANSKGLIDRIANKGRNNDDQTVAK